MWNAIFSLVVTVMLSGCAVKNFNPNKTHINQSSAVMPPGQYGKPTKSQRAAIMSGERPDWGRRYDDALRLRW